MSSTENATTATTTPAPPPTSTTGELSSTDTAATSTTTIEIASEAAVEFGLPLDDQFELQNHSNLTHNDNNTNVTRITAEDDEYDEYDDDNNTTEVTALQRAPPTRRDWLRAGVLVIGGCVVTSLGASTTTTTTTASSTPPPPKPPPLPAPPATQMTSTTTTATTTTAKNRTVTAGSPSSGSKKLAPVNLTKVVQETRINVTLECTTTCLTLDSEHFRILQRVKLPPWVPSFLVPQPKVIKDISNTELLTAGIVAGSAVEMGRTLLLYPLLTLKTRVQSSSYKIPRKRRRLRLRRRIKVLYLNARRHSEEGQLYAGLLPSLLVTVPATGVYFGVRDVTKRVLQEMVHMPQFAFLSPVLSSSSGSLSIAIAAVFMADTVSLMFRTPADTLALRLQAATGEVSSHRKSEEDSNEDKEDDKKKDDEKHYFVTINGDDDDDEKDKEEVEAEEQAADKAKVNAMVGNWFTDSIERLPIVVITDLPYLVSRVILMAPLIQQQGGGLVDMGRYEISAITTALLAAFLTTPFDVVRTRILVDSDGDPKNGLDGGSRQGLLPTFRSIMKEGDGGLPNLFAGWFERTLYLGVGRAWLEPLQVVGYIAIRDAILLQWFD